MSKIQQVTFMNISHHSYLHQLGTLPPDQLSAFIHGLTTDELKLLIPAC